MEEKKIGQVKISNDVIATIAVISALEVEGIETSTTFADKLLKNNGVKVLVEEDFVSVDIAIIVKYGKSIAEIATQVQENIKNTVETMTGLVVSQINVLVQGISFKKDKAEKEEIKAAAKKG
ncbi:MAG: Asp23/Gls24 family envelope stress response protein [Clostridioides sp.]|jgi:uncharacterized alkaline shock family protein YloU|nr:Asp23/Gls24 family envelope stress response protein [Clostridioides sp.]